MQILLVTVPSVRTSVAKIQFDLGDLA